MQYADSAASRLTVTLERLPLAQRQRNIFWLFVSLPFGLVGGAATKKVVVTRLETGEVVAAAEIDSSFEYVADDMRRDLAKLDETAWISRWGNPRVWAGVLDRR